MLDIAVKNTLKQYFSPEENGVLISYMVIEKSQFLIWGVYYSPPCIFMTYDHDVPNDTKPKKLHFLRKKIEILKK